MLQSCVCLRLGRPLQTGRRFLLLGDCGPSTTTTCALYACPNDLTRAWVRGNAISSIDSGATIDKTSGGLGGFGDRRLFQILRDLADVIVVGAALYAPRTMPAPRCRSEGARLARTADNRGPPLAVVTRSGNLDRDLAVLTHTGLVPLVLTCSAAAKTARAQLGSSAEVVNARVRIRPTSTQPNCCSLAERNLVRVLVEGGPTVMDAHRTRPPRRILRYPTLRCSSRVRPNGSPRDPGM